MGCFSEVATLNTTFSENKVQFATGDINSTLNVSWYLNVNVTWKNNISAEYADVTITDNLTNEVFNGSTDENGCIKNMIVQEYIKNQTSTTYFTPYTITANKNGYYGLATVNMNQNQDMIIYLEEDKTPPNAEAGDEKTVDEDMEIELNASLSSDNIGIINYTWRFVDQGKQITLYGITVKYNFIQPGFYTVTLNVSDEAGNHDTDIVNIIVSDVTKPDIKIVSPEPVVHSRDCTVKCVVVDNVKVERVEVSLNNQSWSSCVRENTDGYTATLILEKGGNTVYIRATDSSGNVNTTSITVFVETPEDVFLVFTSDTIMLLIGIIFCITLTIILERKPKRKSGL
jgi:hypothetical protein